MPRESINAIKGLYPHTINELEDGLSTPPLQEFKPYRIIGTACHDCVKDRLSTPPLLEFKQDHIQVIYPLSVSLLHNLNIINMLQADKSATARAESISHERVISV